MKTIIYAIVIGLGLSSTAFADFFDANHQGENGSSDTPVVHNFKSNTPFSGGDTRSQFLSRYLIIQS